MNYFYFFLILDLYLYFEFASFLQKKQFFSKFKYCFIEKFYSTKQSLFKLELPGGKILPYDEILSANQLEAIWKNLSSNTNQLSFIFDQHQQTNQTYCTIEPYLYSVFPIYMSKLKMIKQVTLLLKNLLTEGPELEKKLYFFNKQVLDSTNILHKYINNRNLVGLVENNDTKNYLLITNLEITTILKSDYWFSYWD